MQQQQQTQMLDEADETGGHAFLNTNQLAEAAAEVIEKDGSFYTLTYTPRDYKLDHKWHRVKVQVEGGTYTLSYRRGYYDDGSPDSAKPEGSRAVLRAEGDEKMQMPEARSEPIIFEASVQPAGAVPASPTGVGAPKKDETAYAIHYVVPVSAFARETVAKGERLRIGAGVLVFNAQGRTVDRVSDEFRPTFDAELLQAKPASKYGFDQRVNLPKGADYLYVVIWDMTSGRMGTVQVPVVVGKR